MSALQLLKAANTPARTCSIHRSDLGLWHTRSVEIDRVRLNTRTKSDGEQNDKRCTFAPIFLGQARNTASYDRHAIHA